jgi:hypothetical protein
MRRLVKVLHCWRFTVLDKYRPSMGFEALHFWAEDAQAELDALRKDAERYRKWRADYTAAVANHGDGSCVTEMLLALADAWTPEDVDASIDAAPAVGAA